MAAGDIIQMLCVSAMGDQIGLNVRHWVVQSQTGAGALLSEMATVFNSTFRPLYLPLLNQSANFLGCTAQKIHPAPQSLVAASSAAPEAGTDLADPQAKQVSGLIRLGTLFAGRSQRGRVYVPFPSEDANNGVTAGPSTGYVTNLQALGDELITQLVVVGTVASSTLDPILLHRPLNDFDVLVSAVARTRWATQRRRGDFGRQNPIEMPGVIPIG